MRFTKDADGWWPCPVCQMRHSRRKWLKAHYERCHDPGGNPRGPFEEVLSRPRPAEPPRTLTIQDITDLLEKIEPFLMPRHVIPHA